VIYLGIVPLLLIFLYFLNLKIKQIKQAKIAQQEKLTGKEVNFLECSFFPFQFLTPVQKEKLAHKIIYFLEDKSFYSINDEVEISNDMKLIVAAEACLMILNRPGVTSYPTLKSIYIIEGAYFDKNQEISPERMKAPGELRLGESWLGGPLVLSWESVEHSLKFWNEGQNVVLHEFTHQLDGLDHKMDGVPVLKTAKDYKLWQVIMAETFLDLKEKALHHRKSDIDFYGTTNEAEFFAVTVEEFFTHAKIQQHKHPKLYKLYKDYFELDPATWIIKS